MKEVEGKIVNEKVKKDTVLTIGMVGQPNVGKSSVINQLKGEKVHRVIVCSHCQVVSVSANPGHTKWTQDVHISDEIKLCDCPGLVFPLLGIERSLQIILGVISSNCCFFSVVRNKCYFPSYL